MQDLPPRRAQLSVDYISDHVMGEAIAARTAYTCFLLAQEPTTDGPLQALDACLHPHFGQLPQQLRGCLVPQHGTGLHQLARGRLEPCQARQDHRAHRDWYQRAPGSLLHESRGHLSGWLQPPGTIRAQAWDQPLPVAEQLECFQQVQRLPACVHKQEVTQRGKLRLRCGRRLGPLRGGHSRAVLTLFTSTAGSRLRLHGDGLKELDGLRLAQRLQRDPRDRQVAAQVGEICRELRVEFHPLTAYRTQQQHPAAMGLPVPSQVAQQVEGGPIYPVQVIQQQHQRRTLAQGVHQPRYRFKQPQLGGQLILGGSRQIRVAHPQFRQQTRQFGQPKVIQQILQRVFLLQPLAYSLDQRLIGQSSPHLESLPTQDIAT